MKKQNEISNKQSSEIMLAYWDKNQICRYANNAYFPWLGKSSKDLINKLLLKDLLVHKFYKKNLSQILLTLKGCPQAIESELILPSGEIKSVVANYTPDFYKGNVEGFYEHIVDTTLYKKQNKELKQSIDIYKSQNKRLLNFSNIVTHNLKAYSNNLSSLLDLFITAKSDREKEETFKHLKNISIDFSSTVNNLNEIVEVQNLISLKARLLNLYDYIEESRKLFSIQIKKNNIIIKNNIPPHIMLLSNPAYMKSILSNIISNSIKYRYPKRQCIININYSQSENYFILKIADNGLGINLNKYRDDLFGMYKTFHNNSDANGIGLYIVKYQIESMGGYIEVDSEEDVGTTFLIYLKFNPSTL